MEQSQRVIDHETSVHALTDVTAVTAVRSVYMEDAGACAKQAIAREVRSNWRERLLHSRIGRMTSALALTAGFGGASELVMTSPGSAATAPIRPMQIANEITRYYEQTFNDGFPINLHTQTTTAHSLAYTGFCHTRGWLKYSDNNAMYWFFGQRTSKYVECMVSQVDGHHPTWIGKSTPTWKNHPIDFTSALDQAGNQAADYAGVNYSQHGATTKILVDREPRKHSAEVDVYYNRSGSGAGRQVKELILRVVSGRETVRRIYYS